MSHVSLYFHCVFSTKDRQPLITESLQDRLWAFMGGIARQNDMMAIQIGGIEDHVHLLLSLHQAQSVAKAMQLIKAGSSKWVHDTFPDSSSFEWQQKFGAFSVSASQLDEVIAYIKNQREHHQKMTFQEEYRLLLDNHKIQYDEKYLWG